MNINTFITNLKHFVRLELANPKWNNIIQFLVCNDATPVQVEKVATLLQECTPNFNLELFKNTVTKKQQLVEKYTQKTTANKDIQPETT